MIRTIAAFIGALAGTGVMALIIATMPRVPKLSAALERLQPQTITATTETGTTRLERSGMLLRRHLERYPIPGITPAPTDIAILDLTPTTLWTRKTAGTLAGLIAVPTLTLVAALIGVHIPVAPPALATIAIGIGGFVLPDVQVTRTAAHARKDFARAVSIYLELIAMNRTSGAGTSQSIREAAAVAQSWPFERIRRLLDEASLAGTPPWNALTDLATTIDVPQLRDVADIMRQAGEQSAQVATALQARADAMRSTQLANEQAEAASSAVGLSAIVALLALIVVVTFLFPALTQLATP